MLYRIVPLQGNEKSADLGSSDSITIDYPGICPPLIDTDLKPLNELNISWKTLLASSGCWLFLSPLRSSTCSQTLGFSVSQTNSPPLSTTSGFITQYASNSLLYNSSTVVRYDCYNTKFMSTWCMERWKLSHYIPDVLKAYRRYLRISSHTITLECHAIELPYHTQRKGIM